MKLHPNELTIVLAFLCIYAAPVNATFIPPAGGGGVIRNAGGNIRRKNSNNERILAEKSHVRIHKYSAPLHSKKLLEVETRDKPSVTTPKKPVVPRPIENIGKIQFPKSSSKRIRPNNKNSSTSSPYDYDLSSLSQHQVIQSNAWILRHVPLGKFNANRDVVLRSHTIDLQAIETDEVVIETDAISIDAFIRTTMGKKEAYHGTVNVNSPLNAFGYGKVIRAGRNTPFSKGDMVVGMIQAATYSKLKCDGLHKMQTLPLTPPQTALHVLGISGITAWIGLFASPPQGPRKGETVVVSAAAGAVGCIAAQMAKLTGARVIGIAGGKVKKQFLLDTLGLDGAIDYKDGDKSLGQQLDEECPNGVDFFFDNVGGKTLDAVLERINKNSRISLCGAISEYDSGKINNKSTIVGPSHCIRLAETSSSMTGFNVMHHTKSFCSAIRYLGWNYYRGNIICPEKVVDGLDQFPSAIETMFRPGGHCGRLIVDVSGKIVSSKKGGEENKQQQGGLSSLL